MARNKDFIPIEKNKNFKPFEPNLIFIKLWRVLNRKQQFHVLLTRFVRKKKKKEMAKPNNPNGIVAFREASHRETVPKICLARYKEYFSVKKKRWNGAKNEQREKRVATRRGEPYFSIRPRYTTFFLRSFFSPISKTRGVGDDNFAPPVVGPPLLPLRIVFPRGGVLFWFRNRIPWISEEKAGGEGGQVETAPK